MANFSSKLSNVAPLSQVGMFGVKSAAAFEQTIRHAIGAATADAESNSSAKLKTQLNAQRKMLENSHKPFGLGVVKLGYSPTLFSRSQPTTLPTKTKTLEEEKTNILPFKPPTPTL